MGGTSGNEASCDMFRAGGGAGALLPTRSY